ncbi:MAG: hypothetical protein WC213_09330 [Arenimonas sp.]
MSVTRKMTGSALCLAAALVVANVAQAQSTTPAPAAAKAQATPDGIFARWDKDKNKALSVEEFKAGWQEIQTANALRKLHANFVAMDSNKSGALEANEYANLELIKKGGKAAPLLSAFDTDKNQRLEFKEYVGMVNSLVAKKN